MKSPPPVYRPFAMNAAGRQARPNVPAAAILPRTQAQPAHSGALQAKVNDAPPSYRLAAAPIKKAGPVPFTPLRQPLALAHPDARMRTVTVAQAKSPPRGIAHGALPFDSARGKVLLATPASQAGRPSGHPQVRTIQRSAPSWIGGVDPDLTESDDEGALSDVDEAPTRGNWTLQNGAILTPASKNTKSGYLPGGQSLIKRPRRKYASDLESQEQVLGQISIGLYHAVKTANNKVTEVEAMYAGRSLFISGNSISEAEALYQKMAGIDRETLIQQMSVPINKGGMHHKVTKRVGGKMLKLLKGTRVKGSAGAVFDNLGASASRAIKQIDLAQVSKTQALQAIQSGGTWVVYGVHHAEVNLVKLLEKADYKQQAVIQGKKRACAACASYMRLRNKEGYTIHFSDFPGKIWKDEYEKYDKDRAVQHEIDQDMKTRAQGYRSHSSEQYRSDSESEAD